MYCLGFRTRNSGLTALPEQALWLRVQGLAFRFDSFRFTIGLKPVAYRKTQECPDLLTHLLCNLYRYTCMFRTYSRI